MLLVSLLGCATDERVAMIESHRAKAVPQLVAIKALAPIVAAAPPLPREAWPPTVPFVVGGDTQLVWEEDLADPCRSFGKLWTHAPLQVEFDQSELWLAGPACVYGDPPSNEHGERLEVGLAALERVKYVIVVRAPKAERPSISGSKSSFKAGRLAGDALMYELATKQIVGGFKFDVTHGDRLVVSDATRQAQLDADLVGEFDTRIATALAH